MSMDLQVVWEVMKWPFVACLLFPPLLVYLGLHVVKREVIFVDLALAQVATLGTCVALLMGYHFDDRITFWISLGVTFIGAAFFSWSRSTTKGPVPQEAIIGITFVVAAAGVILLLSRVAGGKEELEHLLTGDILNATREDIGQRALVFAVLFVAMLVAGHLASLYLGRSGVYALAAVMGIADVDPFILSMTQEAAASTGASVAAPARTPASPQWPRRAPSSAPAVIAIRTDSL